MNVLNCVHSTVYTCTYICRQDDKNCFDKYLFFSSNMQHSILYIFISHINNLFNSKFQSWMSRKPLLYNGDSLSILLQYTVNKVIYNI